ncbi:dienelactone hydrolase family protein [Mycolicibacterium sp. F2034L]|uniref:dienelactone hydrolase family protein n=1 Tax=Mycolicibacterium sp. F2034L TaxID=2926422 RepID=UPI001FF3EB69|nr:alpha/beta fold hydrolase [Mycolicibacterium sp. F2034L]MCK0174172.1 esterase [Mycolicibacterium sp. F2034L]
MQTHEYAPGRSADLYGDPGRPTVLLWHGMQTDSRAAVRPLAERIAARGHRVVAPDWNSHADDRGRSDLLASARFAADQAGGDGALVVVGWSMGGAAAAGLTLAADRHGVPVARAVTLGGAFMAPDPLSGARLGDAPPSGDPVPMLLLHGSGDDVVPASSSSEFAAVLRGYGWPVEFVELAADHGDIAGARYDAAADRYEPADDPAALAVADDVAARIVGSFPS